LPLAGNYQPLNLSLALALAELYMKTKDRELVEEKVRESLKHIGVKGRLEVIKEKPLIIADASHNPEGIENFVENIITYAGNRRKIIIFAVLKDKDYESMVKKIISVSDVLILTSSQNTRSLDIDKLEEVVKEKIKESVNGGGGHKVELYKIDSIENSIKFALKISDINDIICITGSITNLENIVR
jgi:dihydrofolate synthase/folylpolyglutamate synthase